MAEEPGHEPGADILEGKGRSMEEFQGVDPFFHRHGRVVEGEGFRDDPVQVRAGNVLAEERGGHFLADLHEGKLGKAAEPVLG